MYNSNMQVRKKKDLSAFYRIKLLLFWLINTTRCHGLLILTYFTDKYAFVKLSNTTYYYDYYYYNYIITNIDRIFTKILL